MPIEKCENKTKSSLVRRSLENSKNYLNEMHVRNSQILATSIKHPNNQSQVVLQTLLTAEQVSNNESLLTHSLSTTLE